MLKNFKIIFFIGFILISSFLMGTNKEINAFIDNDIYYFSVSDFCDAQNYKYIYYEDKAKVAIFFDNLKMTFSANSSFVQIDKQTVHLLNNMIFKDNIFYLPANSFNILSKYYFTPTVSYNKPQKTFSIIPFLADEIVINIEDNI